jgi:hypothetical protein
MKDEKINFRRKTIMNNEKVGRILQTFVMKNLIEIENNHLKFEFETDGNYKIIKLLNY